MNKKQITALMCRVLGRDSIRERNVTELGLRAWAFVAAVVIGLISSASDGNAQSVGTVAQPVRVTVPINSTLSNGVAFTTTLSGTVNPETLSLSSLPAGVTYSFSTNNFTNTVSGTLSLFTTDVPEGIYTYSLDENGDATGNLLLQIQSAHLWTGAVSSDFADAGNWAGGLPGPGDDIVFTDTNGLGHGATTTNVWVTANTEIGSLRQAITSGGTRRDNIQIDDGVTLSITGTNGVSLGLRDNSDTYQSWEFAFMGNGGTLVVSNQDADFDTFAIENQTPYYYMDNLGTFVANLHQIHLSDYTVYPNWQSLQDNGYKNAALPRRLPVPEFHWARTNLVYLNFAGDPNDWNDPAIHQYSMMVGNDNYISGSTQRHPFYFGIYNLFEMNSVCFAGSGVSMDSSGAAKFNTAFTASNCIAIFRGTNGMSDRMAMFAIADNAGVGASGSSSKAVIDFSAGTIDALVDKLYIGRDRTNSSGSIGQGVLTIGQGTFDVNTAILGYQSLSNNLGTGIDYCQATVNVTSNGLFNVNDELALGYTSAELTNTASAQSGFGKVNISSGGTVAANTITVGGITKISADNEINLNGGNLVVSNTIASAEKPLTTLSFANDSTMTLFVDGTATEPYVYTTNLTTSGNNIINIGAVANPASVVIPLISYVTPGASFAGVTMPSGLTGNLVDDGVGTIYLQISTNAPKNLAWRGYVDGNWDLTTKNWLDLDTGIQTNFANGDNATFDDTAAIPTTITIPSAIVATSITVTNTANAYVFSGSGNLIGHIVKDGDNSLEIDAPTSVSIEIDKGSLIGSGVGSVGQVTVLSGAEMNYQGKIKGAILCGGIGTVSGDVVGAVTLQSGSVFTNNGTIHNSFTTADGSLLVNELNAQFVNFGTCTVASNSIVINRGYIGGQSQSTAGQNVTVNNGGTFEDTGEGWLILNGTLTIGSGGTFIPGGDGIGTTYVYKGSVSSGFPARILLSQGSTNIFKVNKDLGLNTQIQGDYVDYGGSSSVPNNNGCTLQFVNVGSTPFAAGDTFTIARYSESGGSFSTFTGTATNTYPVMDPPAPADGLGWNINNLTMSGVVNIVGVSTNTFNVGFTPTFTTLITPTSTNAAIIGNLSWPGTNTGWRLQQLQTALTNGLSATNWTDVFGSQWTNSYTFTNNVTTNTATFYRMVYP
ncbi:MAG TPA: hypothetical protein VFV23_02330 [Verrucomicrobiae bacterium]|nr:hypothetical protein [Verrucomicrobiae bacterium]